MIINESYGNLFDLEETHYLAHCISADFALGAGIAIQFEKRYHIRSKLRRLIKLQNIESTHPTCYRIGNTYNLVTKNKYYHKPTYTAIQDALIYMRNDMIVNKITKVAMPRIATGLDRKRWNKVKEIIIDVFKDTDIEIEIKRGIKHENT